MSISSTADNLGSVAEQTASSEGGQKESEVQPADMAESSHSVEVRIKGRWVAVPILEVNGDKLITKGKRLKIAYVRGEEMREKELESPEIYLTALKSNGNRVLKADIFSFTQKLPAT